MFKAKVNDQFELEISENDSDFLINNAVVSPNIHKVSEQYFHVILNNKSYRAEIEDIDYRLKAFTIKINGKTGTVHLQDKFDLLLEKLGMSNLDTTAANEVKAPMPGLILDIKVKVGDVVEKGDQLLILEAMKMENVIKAAGSATVKEIKINKGDSVEKNQILIQF